MKPEGGGPVRTSSAFSRRCKLHPAVLLTRVPAHSNARPYGRISLAFVLSTRTFCVRTAQGPGLKRCVYTRIPSDAYYPRLQRFAYALISIYIPRMEYYICNIKRPPAKAKEAFVPLHQCSTQSYVWGIGKCGRMKKNSFEYWFFLLRPYFFFLLSLSLMLFNKIFFLLDASRAAVSMYAPSG